MQVRIIIIIIIYLTRNVIKFLYISGGLDKSPISLLYSFEKYLKTSCVQKDFEILGSIAGNRVQKRRLQLFHKNSRILCCLEFGFDGELAEFSQIIRDYINHAPICKLIF